MPNIIKRAWNQNRMTQIEDLQGMAFQAESVGHTFQISGVDDEGNTVALSGTVTGVFLRPDNTDVAISGSASGGVVSVSLPANCYDVPGRFALTIFLTASSKKTAIYAAIGTVSRTTSGSVAPSTASDVVDLINQISLAVATIPASWSGLMADIAPTYSASALYPVGSYCYYNGDLYRCTTAITTAETWTASHWTAAVLGNDLRDKINAEAAAREEADNDLKSALNDSKYGFWSNNFVVASGSSHSSANDILNVSIPAGDVFTITVTGVNYCNIYAFYTDGTGDRLTVSTTTYKGSAQKEIHGIGIYFDATSEDRNVTVNVILQESVYTTVTEEVPEIVKSVDRTTEAIHVLGTEFNEKIFPKFELGTLSSTDGSEIDSTSTCRMVDYIPVENVTYFYCGSRSGALYCYGYNYENGAYVYSTRNQITSTADLTSWLKGRPYSHFRLTWNKADINQVPDWLTLKLKTNLEKISAVEKIDFGRINKPARELLISILQNSVYNANVSQKITMLERQLFEAGELVIIATGKRYAQGGSSSDSENHCITDYYPIPDDETKVTVYMAVDDLTKLGSPFILFRNDTDGLVAYANMANSGRQNAEYTITKNSAAKYVGFTLITDSAQKSYAYFPDSGNLIFAGSQSKYSGLKNIMQKGVDA